MDNYYLDNIYMYGAQASDIVLSYESINGVFEDVTYRDSPENLMDYIFGNTKAVYNRSNCSAYKMVFDYLKNHSEKSKFPLVKWLISLAVVYSISLGLMIIKSGTDNILKYAGISFVITIMFYGPHSGLFLLIRGAIKRDQKYYRDCQRAFATDVYVLNNQIAVLTHAYDYPTYERVINPVGNFIPQELIGLNENVESKAVYSRYPEKEFPFNQLFLINKVNNIERNNGLMRLSVDGTVYTIYKKVIGYRHYNVKRYVQLSKWLVYGMKQSSDMFVVLPDIKELDF